VRQHRLRRTGAEHDQQFVLDVGDEAEDREAGESGDGPEHDHHEQDAGEIERRDQLDQIHERTDPERTDGEGHGAERTDRRRAHDDLDHAKEDLCHPIDDGVDPLAKLSETRDGEAGEDQNQQDLQKIAARESTNEGFRDDPQQMGDKPLLLGAIDVACDRICIERGRIDVEPLAG